MIHSAAKYKVYSILDLKNANNQILVREENKTLNAFEAGGERY